MKMINCMVNAPLSNSVSLPTAFSSNNARSALKWRKKGLSLRNIKFAESAFKNLQKLAAIMSKWKRQKNARYLLSLLRREISAIFQSKESFFYYHSLKWDQSFQQLDARGHNRTLPEQKVCWSVRRAGVKVALPVLEPVISPAFKDSVGSDGFVGESIYFL